MRLCFGTFGTVLKCCSALTEKELVGKLVRIVDPLSRYIDNGPAIHRLMNCDIDFVVSSYYEQDKATKANVIKGFENEVLPYLHADKLERIVLALCDIIHKDKAIDINHKTPFRNFFSVDKQALLKQHEYILSDFLASALLFTVREVKNKVGKSCVKIITPDYIDKVNERYQDEVGKNPIARIIVFPSSQILNVFKQAIRECRIDEFIENDPTVSLKESFLEESERFVKILTNVVTQLDGKSELHQKICNFTQILNEYLSYLGLNMRPLQGVKDTSIPINEDDIDITLPVNKILSDVIRPIQPTYYVKDIFVPLHRDENVKWAMAFHNSTIEYRRKIICSYQEICGVNN